MNFAEYIFLISLGWWIIEFEPFTLIMMWINEKTGRKPWFEYVSSIVTCWQCATFWSSLVYTQSLKDAILAAFFVFVIERVHEIWSRRR